MAYRLLAGSCSNGPCPTFHIETMTGDVKVQGYVTDSPVVLPTGEDVVHIPADAWRRLLADLPIGVLLRALVSHLLRRPAVSQPQYL